MTITYFDDLTRDLYPGAEPPTLFFDRAWSYGDVESNGIYYHPQLTHYAHQAFEHFFHERTGLTYSDLSRQSTESDAARTAHDPPLPRMTFPVEWLHQWMLLPMKAGDGYRIGVDTVDVAANRVGVRAWVVNSQLRLAAIVIWLRAAVLLDPERKSVDIPAWFPRG
jgi:hypothetical protein